MNDFGVGGTKDKLRKINLENTVDISGGMDSNNGRCPTCGMDVGFNAAGYTCCCPRCTARNGVKNLL